MLRRLSVGCLRWPAQVLRRPAQVFTRHVAQLPKLLAPRLRLDPIATTLGAAAWAAACVAYTQMDQAPGASIEDDYELGAELGFGAFASVRRATCRRTGKTVAVKVVPKSKMTAASIRHEASVLKKVGMHTRVASLEAVYETDELFYIVMEYVGGGDILDYLMEHGPYKETEAATLISELAGAIAIMHAQDMCHADIKPENLLLTSDGHVKLVDFGLSAQFNHEKKRVDPNGADPSGAIGTLAYFSPEMFASGAPSRQADLWALGVITYMLLTAGHPFDDDGQASDAVLVENIQHHEPSFGKYWTSSESAKT